MSSWIPRPRPILDAGPCKAMLLRVEWAIGQMMADLNLCLANVYVYIL